MAQLYPLRFREILRNYRFGDRWIVEVFAKEGLPEDHRVAETWEVCDRPGESSVVTNGPLAGRTLHELIDEHNAALLGDDIVARCGTRFPLLIKFLDASNPLGEQIHQDDALARRQGLDDPGKTEAWYMLHAREGATIHCAARDGVSEADVRDALLAGTIREQMREYLVVPGDAFLLYAGAMHYSRGGVLFYEIMQNSDVIMGLRKPDEALPPEERAARVEAMMEGIHLEEGFEPKARPVTVCQDTNRRTYCFACTYFCLERLDLTAPYALACDGQRFYFLSQIEGQVTVACDGHRKVLRRGQSCLLPASLGEVTLEPHGACSLLVAYVPDLVANIVEPLRRAGFADADIAWLGGRTRLNPLPVLLAG